MVNNDITLFGETNFRNEKRRFGIKADDRRRHMYIVGKTGTGKTTTLENMIIADIVNGRGVGFIDPHGESAEKILNFVPQERIKDVIYFNPADTDYPIAFNAIEKVDPEKKHLIASGLMGVFKKIWPDVWSARMEYILNNTILALLEYPGATLLGIMRMLSSKEYRKEVVSSLQDPVVKSFWVDEFAKYTDRFTAEATPAIQNKVGQFLAASLVRNIVGQNESAIDMRRVMDEGKILIMNLSKGRIGEDNSKLLGGLLVTKIQLAAMSRVDMPEEERRDFFLYVDEFQNFATESFATILSEARKYHLGLILANQYIAQLIQTVGGVKSTSVRDAIFGNVGTIICFRIGADDAEFLEKEFSPEFEATDLVNLSNYSIYLKLMIDGVTSRAFSAATLLPFPKQPVSFEQEIIEFSRQNYGTPREKVEQEIAQAIGFDDLIISPKEKTALTNQTADLTESLKSKIPAISDKKLYEAVCWEGGEKVLVPFEPDGVRPIFCKKHIYRLSEIRQQATQDSPQPVSLKEAFSKPMAQFQSAPPKKKKTKIKPQPNLDELRSLLSEIKPIN